MTSHPLPRWLGIALILVIATIFAGNHIAARIAIDHGVSVVTAVAVRSTVTALFLLALLALLGAPIRIPAAKFYRALVIGVLVAGQSYCLYSAVALLPVALALLAFNLHPMLYAFLTAAAGLERVAPRALVVMLVALFGLALTLDVVGTTARMAARWTEIGGGVAYALAAALQFALLLFLSGRWLVGMDGRLRACITMGFCGVLAFAAGALTGTLTMPADAPGWLGLALLTIFYGTAMTAVFALQPRLRSASDVVVFNFEPIAALFLGWAILGQTVSPLQIAGALIVIGAIIALGMARR